MRYEYMFILTHCGQFLGYIGMNTIPKDGQFVRIPLKANTGAMPSDGDGGLASEASLELMGANVIHDIIEDDWGDWQKVRIDLTGDLHERWHDGEGVVKV